MKIFTSFKAIPRNLKAYITIGKFDGLHLGHLKVLEKLTSIAKKNNAQSMVISFKKNPFLTPEENYKMMTLTKKKTILTHLGVDNFLEISLSRYQKMSYQEFLWKIIKQFDCQGMVASDKLYIGFQKEGDYRKIGDFFEKVEKTALIIPSYKKKEKKLSTTMIKHLIQKGQIEEANRLLYLPFSIAGEVASGEKIGRTINFPTINLPYPKELLKLKAGSYISLLYFSKKIYPAMTYVGNNFLLRKNRDLKIESYVLNFNSIIYHKQVEFFFLCFLEESLVLHNADELRKLLIHYQKKTTSFFKKRKKIVDAIAFKLGAKTMKI